MVSVLLERLRESTVVRSEGFVVRWVVGRERRNGFLVLLSIVLSQNTSDRNALVALRRLLDFGVRDPADFLSADENSVMEALRPAGLYRQRYNVLRGIAVFLRDHPGWLDELCSLDPGVARKRLLGFRGIGVKTADVFLSVYCGHPVFPVDRHILRITKRVTGSDRVSYDEASEYWKKVFTPDEYGEAHVRLIEVGRRYCRPVKPLCSECPLREACSYPKRKKEEEKH